MKKIMTALLCLVFTSATAASDITQKSNHKTYLKTNSAAHCSLPSGKLDHNCSHTSTAKSPSIRRF